MILLEIDVFNNEGKQVSKIQAPKAFEASRRQWLIDRAIVAENSIKLQPQAHALLAGMNTTAAYFGAMGSYRTGRHVGRAIRPREKLGGGALGKVRRIPSSVTGKRAHPHQVEKTLIEKMNNREYSKALESAVAASVQNGKPPMVFEDISKIAKTRDFTKMLHVTKMSDVLEAVKSKKVVTRRRTRTKVQHRMLIVTADKEGELKASRNLKGVEVCTLSGLRVEKLAPGGVPVKAVVWSSKAIEGLDKAIGNAVLIRKGARNGDA